MMQVNGPDGNEQERRRLKQRVIRLEALLRALVDMEVDRYACASERNAVFARAREALENQR